MFKQKHNSYPSAILKYLPNIFISLVLIALFYPTPPTAKSNDLNEQPLPYRLKRISGPISIIPETQKLIITDINNDLTDEVVKIVNSKEKRAPGYLVITDWSQSRLFNDQLNIKGHFLGINCFDVRGSRDKEIVFFELQGDTISLSIYSLENYVPRRLRYFKIEQIPLPPPDVKTNFTIEPIKVLDWDRNGSPDLLCVVTTTYGYQPRGIWIFDLRTGRVILKKQVGPIVKNVVVLDVDNDGKEEIIFGGKAANNCQGLSDSDRFFNGTDDSQSWLFIIDDNGDLLLKMITGETASATSILVSDMNHDNKPEIIVFTVEGQARRSSSVSFLDLKTKSLIKRRYRPQLINLSSGFLDWQEDGKNDFISLWSDGLLEIRDIQNNVLNAIETGLMGLSSTKIIDIEQDGEKEICLYGNSGFLLLDSHLKPLAYDPIKVLDLQSFSPGHGQKRLFQIVTANKVSIYKLDKNISHLFFSPTTSAITFLLGALLALAIAVIINYVNKGKCLPINNLPPSTLFFLFDSSGKIHHMAENVRQFIQLPSETKPLSMRDIFNNKEWKPVRTILDESLKQHKTVYNQEIVISQDNKQRYFILNLFPKKIGLLYRVKWILTLQETTELVQSKRAVAWASMAQRLAHEIKTPLSSVMLAAQQLQMKLEPDLPEGDRRIQYIEHIINQVHRLRKTTDIFIKFAHVQPPNFQPAKMNELVENCLEKIKNIIPENIEIHKELEADLPTIWLDQDQIAIAIKNVLENAVNAIGQKGIITVTTRLVQTLQTKTHQETIVLEISDTGCGIGKEQLAHIFEPFFSQQEGGTGLGLTLVKKIVEDHNGNVSVKSQEGIGTTVSISLPIFKLS